MTTVNTPTFRWIALGASIIVLTGAALWVYSAIPGSGRDKERAGAEKADCGLSTLDEDNFVEAMSPSGEYLMLSAQDSDSDILWRDGEEQDTDVSAQELAGINSSGEMAGPSGEPGEPGPTSDFPDEGWKSDGDTETELDPDGPGKVTISGINEDGDVVGTARDVDAEQDLGDGDPVEPRGRPLLWPDGSDKPVELEVEDGKLGHAAIIGAEGDIFGYQVPPDGNEIEPWRWDTEGEGEALPADAGTVHEIAGDWVASSEGRWNLSELDETGEVKTYSSSLEIADIDASGTVYGAVEDNQPARQTVDGEPEELPTLESDDSYKLAEHGVDHASEDGAVLAGNSTEGHEHRQVIWSC